MQITESLFAIDSNYLPERLRRSGLKHPIHVHAIVHI